MIETFQRFLASQFEASLCMLGHCVAKCPDALWNTRVARHPFCQVAFHTLIFTDLYLGPDADSLRQQPFHLANAQFFADYEQLEDREPVSRYERPQIEAYLDFCRTKAAATIAAESDETFAAPANFAHKNFSRAELHLNNIRHIQHHAAQMIMRLRLDSDVDIAWIAAGWKDPAAF
jgi:hypothetical protein